MAVTSQQVTLYMSQRQKGQTQEIAAAKVGLSVRTAWRLYPEGVTCDACSGDNGSGCVREHAG